MSETTSFEALTNIAHIGTRPVVAKAEATLLGPGHLKYPHISLHCPVNLLKHAWSSEQGNTRQSDVPIRLPRM